MPNCQQKPGVEKGQDTCCVYCHKLTACISMQLCHFPELSCRVESLSEGSIFVFNVKLIPKSFSFFCVTLQKQGLKVSYLLMKGNFLIQ